MLISFLFVVNIFLSSQSRRRRATTIATETPTRQSRRLLGRTPPINHQVSPGGGRFTRVDTETEGTTQEENEVGLAMVEEEEKEEEEQEAIVEEEEKEEEEKEDDNDDFMVTNDSSEQESKQENADEEDAVEEHGEAGVAEVCSHCVFMFFCKHDYFCFYNVLCFYYFF